MRAWGVRLRNIFRRRPGPDRPRTARVAPERAHEDAPPTGPGPIRRALKALPGLLWQGLLGLLVLAFGALLPVGAYLGYEYVLRAPHFLVQRFANRLGVGQDSLVHANTPSSIVAMSGGGLSLAKRTASATVSATSSCRRRSLASLNRSFSASSAFK